MITRWPKAAAQLRPTQTAEPVAEDDRLWLQSALEQLAFRSGAPEIDLDDLAVDTPYT